MSFISVQMAKRLGAAGRIEEAQDLAVTVRPSSTANFFVDSLDRVDAGDPNSTSSDFVINKSASLFNGFFSRIAMNEIVMDWGLPNVAQWWGNNFLTVLVDDGASPNGVVYTVTLPDQFLSALDALSALVTALNAAPGMTATWTVGSSGTRVGLGADQNFAVVWEQSASAATVPAGTKPTYDPNNALARGLFSSTQLYTGTAPLATTDPLFTPVKYVVSPLILGTRYVDFVSPQLTYNQDLKDSTTATIVRDAIYRWYFAWDTNTGTDVLPGSPPLYPYQILQGYKPFNQRRILPYPKQILWNPASPIGQVGFQVFDDRGRLLDTSQFTPKANFQFQMSMLLSEN
jgi:hypothetical protein